MWCVEYDVCLRICCVVYVCARRREIVRHEYKEENERVKRARRTRGVIVKGEKVGSVPEICLE